MAEILFPGHAAGKGFYTLIATVITGLPFWLYRGAQAYFDLLYLN